MGRHNLGAKNAPNLPSHTLPFQPHRKLAIAALADYSIYLFTQLFSLLLYLFSMAGCI